MPKPPAGVPGTPRPGDYLRAWPQYVLPHHLLSRAMQRLTRVRQPALKNWMIRTFVRRFGVDLDEALIHSADGFADFNSFFTRALKGGARPIADGPGDVVSPVDGTVSQIGPIHGDSLFQAKGHEYSLVELLGGNSERAAPFHNGAFATLYLSPRDYHRIHAPVDGRLLEMVHVPGRIFSVSPATTRAVPRLFARNERVAALFDTPAGPLGVVMVGAVFVASIETVWAGVVTPPSAPSVRQWDYRGSGMDFSGGEEIGRFNMGSTVILLFGPERVRWEAALAPGTPVRMGQKIAAMAPAPEAGAG